MIGSTGTLEFLKFDTVEDLTNVNNSHKLSLTRRLNCFKSKKPDGSGVVKGVHALVLKPSIILLAGLASTGRGSARTANS